MGNSETNGMLKKTLFCPLTEASNSDRSIQPCFGGRFSGIKKMQFENSNVIKMVNYHIEATVTANNPKIRNDGGLIRDTKTEGKNTNTQ